MLLLLLAFTVMRKLRLRRTHWCIMHKKEVFRDCLAKMAKLMSKPLAYHCLKGSVTMQKQLLCGCFPIATEESFYCLFYCLTVFTVLLLKGKIFLITPVFQIAYQIVFGHLFGLLRGGDGWGNQQPYAHCVHPIPSQPLNKWTSRWSHT